MQPGPAPKLGLFDFLARWYVARRLLNTVIAIVLVGGCCGGFCLFGIVGSGVAGVMQARANQTFGPLSVVCAGHGVPGAPAFVEGRPHRGVAFADGSSDVDTGRVPDTWSATAIGDDDFVLCLAPPTVATLETCAPVAPLPGPQPGTMAKQRTQQTVTVRAVASSSGTVIAQGDVVGPVPPPCVGADGQPTAEFELAGDAPGPNELGPWLTASLH